MKKVLIIIAIILIVSTGRVKAQNYTITQQSCNLYYNSGNTNRAGTVSLVAVGGNTNVYNCYNATSEKYYKTGFIFRMPISSGNYNISFMVRDTQEISNVIIRSEATNYSCELNTGIVLPVTTASGTGQVTTTYMYTVNCYNVHFTYNANVQAVITRSTPNSSSGYGSDISQHMNFVPVENVTSAINNQTDSIINANSEATIPEAPSSEEAESIEETEAELIENNQFDSSVMNINIDTNTNSFIWSKITSIVQANAKVFSMIITCLSLGIIKLVFNR